MDKKPHTEKTLKYDDYLPVCEVPVREFITISPF